MINIEKKKILKARREKALQNAKDRDAEKVNAQAALQAHTWASKASKDNQDFKMTDDAATHEDSTEYICLHILMEKLNIQAKFRHNQSIELYVQNLY